MQRSGRDLEEGLGDFLRWAGFQAAGDFAPIREDETCDFVAPEDMLRSPAVSPCGKRAKYAALVLEKLALCARHAKEWGYTAPRP